VDRAAHFDRTKTKVISATAGAPRKTEARKQTLSCSAFQRKDARKETASAQNLEELDKEGDAVGNGADIP
jgi:hypothetical protein